MKGLVATARGLEPIDQQRFAPGFLARHVASRWLSDGLVHAFSRTKTTTRAIGAHARITRDGWATFCASGLEHNALPGISRPVASVTCVACMAGLFR